MCFDLSFDMHKLQGLELQVVAAVVVGGVNIFGGSGSLVGALLGTILIATLEQSLLRWRVVSEFWRDALLGLLILLAVAADALIINRLRNWWAQNEIVQISAEPVQEEPAWLRDGASPRMDLD